MVHLKVLLHRLDVLVAIPTNVRVAYPQQPLYALNRFLLGSINNIVSLWAEESTKPAGKGSIEINVNAILDKALGLYFFNRPDIDHLGVVGFEHVLELFRSQGVHHDLLNGVIVEGRVFIDAGIMAEVLRCFRHILQDLGHKRLLVSLFESVVVRLLSAHYAKITLPDVFPT